MSPLSRGVRLERIQRHLRGRGWVPIAELAAWMARELGSQPGHGSNDLAHLCLLGTLERRPTKGQPGDIFRAYEYRLNEAGCAKPPPRREVIPPHPQRDSGAEFQRQAVLQVLAREPDVPVPLDLLKEELPHISRCTLRQRLRELEDSDLVYVRGQGRTALYGAMS